MYSYIHMVLYVDIADACGGPYCTCLSILPSARFQPAVDLFWCAIETTTTPPPLPKG